MSEFTYFLGGVSAESERECVASNDEVTLAGLIDALLRAKVDLKEKKTFILSQHLSNSVSGCSTKIMNTTFL